MAFCILAASLTLDILHKNSTATMFAIPFISSLILGKQYLDKKKDDTTI